MVEGSGVAVLPGDLVHLPSSSTRPGPGVVVVDTAKDKSGKEKVGAVVSKAGLLRRKEEEAVTYVPSESEHVIGVIVKTGRVYRVDIGAHQLAALPELAFEGATKRNKPNLQIGDVVYCRVTLAHRDAEPEVTCVDSSGRSNGMGFLRDRGYLIHCSLSLSRQLLSKSCVVLSELGKYYKYESVVGLNGQVWVSSGSLVVTIVIRNCILASEFMSADAVQEMVSLAAQLH